MELLSENKVAGGWHRRYQHDSLNTQCKMTFAVFLPEQALRGQPVPVLYWLSGLTCNDENFMQKAGAFKRASELGIAIVAPDTSPRGEAIPDDPENSYDFGLGAGFYVNATQAPYDKHYQMYSYVSDELPTLIEAHLPVSDKRAIAGHSMGGHGALIIGLKNPTRYQSISAFSPISNPVDCPWGKKAFTGYLGADSTAWQAYDACHLLRQNEGDKKAPILVDQGDADQFLTEQLKPEALEQAALAADHPFTLTMQPGYDHSYFFISTFIDSHLDFHAQYLK
ncbi:S-formylglutathione hydrolase [Pseudoalteromonas ardens]|uniref:S-formylglutathione hydrolase n=1 Tax=Pseudoalteromonas rubra TaxID=43658 RepID=A0A0L0ES64_9GAMM|nr:S-formylglutathione hydrolase [Pseudoalteromonas sp. R96]KNC66733.1 S-formylglutathione hydrolase [Pseudoalteromonas rubra]MDK1313626.1 S-formylglutathione hydrolase [Pseudoalteromonas sp. R96]